MTRRRRWMIPPAVSLGYGLIGFALGWPASMPVTLVTSDTPVDLFSAMWLPSGWSTDLSLRGGTGLLGAYLGLMLGLAMMAVVMVVTEPKPHW